jgi:hypothetical protein
MRLAAGIFTPDEVRAVTAKPSEVFAIPEFVDPLRMARASIYHRHRRHASATFPFAFRF